MVTVEDAAGNEYIESFEVTVTPDVYNGAPYLTEIPDVTTTVGTPAVFQLDSIDVEGNTVVYDGFRVGSVNYTVSVNNQSGLAVVTPPAGYVGSFEVLVRVSQLAATDTLDEYDSQYVTVNVTPVAPTLVDLLASSDSGVSSTDNLTNETDPQFAISGVIDGATVRLYHNGIVVGQAQASSGSAVITATDLAAGGDDTFDLVATQTFNSMESPVSGILQVTIDTTAPQAFTSNPPVLAAVGQQLVYDAQNGNETGNSYSLVNAPTGISINAATGVMSWTPTGSQVGTHTFSIVASDDAGNTRDQSLNINVSTDAKVSLRVDVTDAQLNPIDAIDVGGTFLVNVYAQDLRLLAEGIFAAFLDVLFDPQLVQVDGQITYGPFYGNGQSGDTDTPGLIDELGAVSNQSTLGGEEQLLASVPMRALKSGEVLFSADPADNLPATTCWCTAKTPLCRTSASSTERIR